MSFIEAEESRMARQESQVLRPQSYVERCELCGRMHRFDSRTRELIDACRGPVIDVGPFYVAEMESDFEERRRFA